MRVCIDPGHGMGNRKLGVYDPGAESCGVEEASVAMDWANELRVILIRDGHKAFRTRINAKDSDPISGRAEIAKEFKCDVMLSIHANAADGKAHGTETFYRGDANKSLAKAVNDACVAALGTRDRGIKTESQSQHSRLAVLSFPRCVLLETGFIDHPGDRAAITDPVKRRAACEAIAKVLCNT